jgi:hypothetical protein
MKKLDAIPAATLKRWLKQHRSLKKAWQANADKYSWHRVQGSYRAHVEAGTFEMLPMGRKTNAELKHPLTKQRAKAMKRKKDDHHTFLLTCAQNNTDVHLPTWQNLLAIAKHRGAKIMVSEFLYAKRGLGARNDKAKLTSRGQQAVDDTIWYDKRVVPFISNDRVEIAKGLVWCGELNILPTAARPLSGLEVYTGRDSMVVPHVRIAMESVATVGGDGAKLNYTTGTVTQRNYIQRKEGFKAEFHHCYGALLVEVDADGHWWARQLNADSDGTIYDLDMCAKDGEVTTGHRIEALNPGDTHEDEKDMEVHAATFSPDGLLDTLAPKYLFINDLLNMGRRNHHKIKDPYAMLVQHAQGKECVENEVHGSMGFLVGARRDWMKTVVVDSNHDRALDRWVRDTDGRYDPINAAFWARLNSLKTNYIMEHRREPALFPLIVSDINPKFWKQNNVTFLAGDESFIICPKSAGGIECGMHGDRGANGSRGSARGFAKLGRRANIGHSHSACIVDGTYQAGTNSLLQLDYNHGPSSWTHSNIVTYANGKRAIVTFFKGKWRA